MVGSRYVSCVEIILVDLYTDDGYLCTVCWNTCGLYFCIVCWYNGGRLGYQWLLFLYHALVYWLIVFMHRVFGILVVSI